MHTSSFQSVNFFRNFLFLILLLPFMLNCCKMAEVYDTGRQEQEKYLKVNEDEILQELTEEELQQLNLDLEEIDPENQLLPAGLRQKDQTTKAPTGSFDREKLQQFIEEEAKNLEDEEEYVPYKPGEKRGKVYQKPEVPKTAFPTAQLDPELEECLNSASEGELTDIAAILGMHTLVNTEQFYSSLKATKVANKTGFSTVTKCDLQTSTVTEPPNPTDVDDTLRRIKDNDSTLTKVNLNNIKNIPIHTLKDYCKSMKVNTNVTSWSLVNTRSNDSVAFAMAEMLKINRTLKILNVESNFITGEGVVAILETLEDNDCLEELRLDNQRQQFGNKVENEMAAILLKNTTLIKLGYHFNLQGPRALVADRLTRNSDLKRRTRVHRNPSSDVTKTYSKK